MQVLISGASGLIGTALINRLQDAGHEGSRLVRSGSMGEPHTVNWDPQASHIDWMGLEGFDAVVHLGGESIAQGRWTEEKKKRIRDSRVEGTQLLCRALAKLEHRPKSFICASAVGYYGDRGDEQLDEDSAPGDDYLAEVCSAWEAAAAPAAEADIRVVNLRFGVVLSADGGALAKMLTPFKLGAGGVIGSGRQFMSWITLDDATAAIQYVLEQDACRGPVNVTAPNPVTNRQFTRALGHALARPTILPMPAPLARLAFGEMADALLLSSQRVDPKRLTDSGFTFQYADLEPALAHVLAAE